jgi:hypothetical protein
MKLPLNPRGLGPDLIKDPQHRPPGKRSTRAYRAADYGVIKADQAASNFTPDEKALVVIKKQTTGTLERRM